METKTFAEMINSPGATLVDFYAEWCGPCKMMKPILEEVKHDMGEAVRIIKIDVEKNPGVAEAFHITGVPTLMVFKNGKVEWRQSGIVPTGHLKQIINNVNK
ncbi:MAG: thioredoxin [Bacteroidetes bacterium]|jgi:thioredoxin 1|nr:thioredoxin [Bacteroidota bacterium]